MALWNGRKVSITRIQPGVDTVSITDAEGKEHSVSKESLIYTDAEVQGMKNRDGEIVKERQASATTTYRTVKSEQEKAKQAATAKDEAAKRQAAQDKLDGTDLLGN
jgi:hypothetical protein